MLVQERRDPAIAGGDPEHPRPCEPVGGRIDASDADQRERVIAQDLVHHVRANVARSKDRDPQRHSKPPFPQNTAIGLTGDPVPFSMRNGAMTEKNSHRPSCSQAAARSSKLMLSA